MQPTDENGDILCPECHEWGPPHDQCAVNITYGTGTDTWHRMCHKCGEAFDAGYRESCARTDADALRRWQNS